MTQPLPMQVPQVFIMGSCCIFDPHFEQYSPLSPACRQEVIINPVIDGKAWIYPKPWQVGQIADISFPQSGQ